MGRSGSLDPFDERESLVFYPRQSLFWEGGDSIDRLLGAVVSNGNLPFANAKFGRRAEWIEGDMVIWDIFLLKSMLR